jgi:hypothetical protein
MIRADVIREVVAYLEANYEGPVNIEPAVNAGTLSTPYAVVRVGSAVQLYPGEVEIWDLNLLIAVFHDADVTSASDAEAQAAAIFAMFDDPEDFTDGSDLVWTALEREETEISLVETRWQHIAAWRAVVAPSAV